MSVTDNRRPVLVADRRYVAARKAAVGSGGGSRKPPAAKAKYAPRRPAPKRNPVAGFFGGILRWMLRMIWGIGWRVAFLLAIVVGSVTLYFYQKLPDVTALLDARARGSVTLLDRNGKVFAWRGETFGGQIDAASVSPNLRNAIVATEDRRFYWHAGVSPRGTATIPSAMGRSTSRLLTMRPLSMTASILPCCDMECCCSSREPCWSSLR